MKRLFSSADPVRTALVKGMLDEEGIEYEVRNETIPYPGPVFYPEVWVLNDEEFPTASELRDSVVRQPTVFSSQTWTCPVCGERLEAQFTACWKCGASRSDIA